MNHNRSIPQVQASAPRASRFTPNTFPAAAIQQEDTAAAPTTVTTESSKHANSRRATNAKIYVRI